MKSFVMKHWRRIIIAFSGLAILINLISVCTMPTTIIDDFYRYGPNYSRDIIDKASNIDVDNMTVEEATEEMENDLSYRSGMPDNLSKGAIIVAILICFLLIFQNIIDGNSAAAKKK